MKAFRVGIAGLLCAGVAPAASAANYISTTAGYTTAATKGLYNGTGFSFYPLDYKKSVTVGGIENTILGSYGAKITGAVKAKLGFDAGVSFTNSVQTQTSGTVSIAAGNPFGALTRGSAFLFSNSFNGGNTISAVGQGQVDAWLNASAYAGAYLYGKACLVACTSGYIVNMGAGNATDFHVLGYHSASNSVDFLDKTYTNQLPQYFQSDTLPITAKLEAVNVSGKASGIDGNHFHTEQQFAGAYLDVAKAVVQVFGLPNSVISGSALGFDYTTVTAKVGIGINAIYDVTTSVLSKYTNYQFSTPVQIYNPGTGKWSAALTGVGISDGQTLIMRTASAVNSLSILPEVLTYGKIDATMKVNVTAQSAIRLLEASGYGLSAGPLYERQDVVELGTLGSFSASRSYLAGTKLAPLTLDFLSTGRADAASLLARLANMGSRAFVFVPDADAPITDTIAGTIRLALNYGTVGCDAEEIVLCRYDTAFEPVALQQRVTLSAAGAPTFGYAVDFDMVDRLEAMPDGAYGVQSTPESIRALLASLPPAGSGGYDLPDPIAFNRTPFMDAVPEPATWAMMVAGFGMMGAAMRRRRRMERVPA